MSKIYGLLDVLYFKNKNRSPRTIAMNYINPNDGMILDICTGTAANAIGIAKRYKESKIVGIDLQDKYYSSKIVIEYAMTRDLF